MNKLPPRWTDRKGNHRSKTDRDHRSGAHARCIKNKEERASWQKRNRIQSPGLQDFPFHTCNGKRARSLRGK